MDITNKIDIYLLGEGAIPKNLKKWFDFCEDHGLSPQEIQKIIKANKGNMDDAVDEMMEEIRDEVSPRDFRKADNLHANATTPD